MSRDYDDDRDDDLEEHRRDDRRDEDDAGDVATQAAMQRTSVPGILLIIVGVLNLLGGGYFLVNGIVVLTAGKEMVKQQVEMQNPEQKKELEKAGIDMDKFIGGAGIGYAIVGGLGIVVAILTIAAGAMMRNLKGYALAVISSILVCIPAISFFGCCLVGQVVGIWSLVVLLSADVKSAFR